MAHIIEEAKSGRASCRTCKKAIAKGELRFGEEFDSQFADGGASHRWHHLACAAAALPDALTATLATYTGELPDRAALDQQIAEGRKKTRPASFPYFDWAPTGRARCLACQVAIDKGALRVAVERTLEVGMQTSKGAGYLHPGCVATHLEKEKLERGPFVDGLRANSRLEPAELDSALAELPT
jgi:poly [ADP-ribose] polymerase